MCVVLEETARYFSTVVTAFYTLNHNVWEFIVFYILMLCIFMLCIFLILSILMDVYSDFLTNRYIF